MMTASMNNSIVKDDSALLANEFTQVQTQSKFQKGGAKSQMELPPLKELHIAAKTKIIRSFKTR
jgi:hypothetical protein